MRASCPLVWLAGRSELGSQLAWTGQSGRARGERAAKHGASSSANPKISRDFLCWPAQIRAGSIGRFMANSRPDCSAGSLFLNSAQCSPSSSRSRPAHAKWRARARTSRPARTFGASSRLLACLRAGPARNSAGQPAGLDRSSLRAAHRQPAEMLPARLQVLAWLPESHVIRRAR